MAIYILFKQQLYAEELKKLALKARDTDCSVRTSEQDLYGINPQDNDIVVVDAHYKGNMSDFGGMEIVSRLQEYECSGKNVKFKILSWFPNESNYLNIQKEQLYSPHNVEFVQLPVLDIKSITT
jgi:hypothetical protein